jgi:hypothetical protein
VHFQGSPVLGEDVFGKESTTAIALMLFDPASKTKQLIYKLIRIYPVASGLSVDPGV